MQQNESLQLSHIADSAHVNTVEQLASLGGQQQSLGISGVDTTPKPIDNVPLVSPLHPFNENHHKHIQDRDESAARRHRLTDHHEKHGNHGHQAHLAHHQHRSYNHYHHHYHHHHHRGRRRNTFHSAADVAHASFDHARHEVEKEIKKYIGMSRRQAHKSIKEANRFARAIEREKEKKHKAELKSKLSKAVGRLGLAQSELMAKRAHESKGDFEEAQRKLKELAALTADQRHRVPNHNALISLGKHECHLVSPAKRTKKNLKKWANAKRHSVHDFACVFQWIFAVHGPMWRD